MIESKIHTTAEIPATLPDGNYSRSWQTILKKAGVEDGTFHDLRSTCITEWLEKGLMPHEVGELAGHADIKTAMNYYVGIRESLIDKARDASSAALGEDFSGAFRARYSKQQKWRERYCFNKFSTSRCG